ncbi:DUF6408 family protein [Streptomyces sp. NPDC002926]
MSPVEYTPARRSWIREVAIGVAGAHTPELSSEIPSRSRTN